MCIHSPAETSKADEVKQKKRPNDGFISGMSVFLPKPIPIHLLSFHLSYNYGVQQEPEVCTLFLKDSKRENIAEELLLQVKIWLQIFLVAKRERWDPQTKKAKFGFFVFSFFFFCFFSQSGSLQLENRPHVESFLSCVAEPLEKQRHLHHFISSPLASFCCSRCPLSEQQRWTADRKTPSKNIF